MTIISIVKKNRISSDMKCPKCDRNMFKMAERVDNKDGIMLITMECEFCKFGLLYPSGSKHSIHKTKARCSLNGLPISIVDLNESKMVLWTDKNCEDCGNFSECYYAKNKEELLQFLF